MYFKNMKFKKIVENFFQAILC